MKTVFNTELTATLDTAVKDHKNHIESFAAWIDALTAVLPSNKRVAYGRAGDIRDHVNTAYGVTNKTAKATDAEKKTYNAAKAFVKYTFDKLRADGWKFLTKDGELDKATVKAQAAASDKAAKAKASKAVADAQAKVESAKTAKAKTNAETKLAEAQMAEAIAYETASEKAARETNPAGFDKMKAQVAAWLENDAAFVDKGSVEQLYLMTQIIAKKD